jgi:hypothetical protein
VSFIIIFRRVDYSLCLRSFAPVALRTHYRALNSPALRAPSATASEEEPNDPFIEDFSNEVMCMAYLYSKLPETGVSPHIGHGGPIYPRLAPLPHR